MENFGGWFYVRSWNFEHFRGGIHDQSAEPSFMLNHENPVAFGGCGCFVSKPFTEVNHGNNLSAKIDHAFHIIGSVGHSCDFRHPYDLLQGSNGDAVGFTSYLKSDNVKFTSHGLGPLALRYPRPAAA